MQPVDGRLPEACYQATRDATTDRVQYTGLVEFDRQEMWRVRVRIASGGKTEEILSEVEATPPGYGRWDLLIYGFPFVFFAALWLYGALRHRRRDRSAAAPQPPGVN